MSIQSKEVLDVSAKAENDLSSKQFYAVELSAADQVDVCDNAADTVLGILQNEPKANEAANVRVLGISQAITDGSGTPIAVHDPLKTNGSGKLIKAVTNNDKLVGRALGASSADGTIIPVLLTPGAYLGA